MGKVCGECACLDFYHASTYVCIICTRYVFVLWYKYVLLRFDNIEGYMLYYLRRLHTNVLNGRCYRVWLATTISAVPWVG